MHFSNKALTLCQDNSMKPQNVSRPVPGPWTQMKQSQFCLSINLFFHVLWIRWTRWDKRCLFYRLSLEKFWENQSDRFWFSGSSCRWELSQDEVRHLQNLLLLQTGSHWSDVTDLNCNFLSKQEVISSNRKSLNSYHWFKRSFPSKQEVKQ